MVVAQCASVVVVLADQSDQPCGGLAQCSGRGYFTTGAAGAAGAVGMNEQEREHWDAWADNQIQIPHLDLEQILGDKPSRRLLRERLYQLGIKPDEFLVQRVPGRSWISQFSPQRFAVYQIRFRDKTCQALARISLEI
jgi:hypothetical protein